MKIINDWDITENEKKDKKEEEMKDVVEEFVCVQKLDNNLRRTQKRLRRVINSNLGQYEEQDKFLTLTCPKLKSREKACRMFKTFIKNLRYNYGDKIQYIAVMEIQNGDRLEDPSKATKDIHFHVLLFDCPYIPQKVLQDKVWKHGIVDIRKIQDYTDISGYLVNYLSKDDTLCVKGKKSYFPSKKLKKPTEEISMNEDLIFKFLSDTRNEVQFSTEYFVERVGNISYMKLIQKDDDESEISIIS
ncbi:rolling circle replication-associated protein [Coprobacillus cateniformis]|nr:hypothetical protein [Coprobacillus cateniformis]